MKIAVSACLMGEPCRYDGTSCACEVVVSLSEMHELVSVCPEVLGGLGTPRPANEIVSADRGLRVVDAENNEVTQAFLDGASRTLARVREEGCVLAVLKSKSPSCGSGLIYDGTFSGTCILGYGVTSRLLRAEGVRVLDEVQLQALLGVSQTMHPGQRPAIFAQVSADCPALRTERLVLRPITLEDAKDVFSYCRDPDIGADAGWPPHRSIEDSRTFIEMVASAPHVYGVFERREGDREGMQGVGPCIGSVGLVPDPQRKNIDCLMLGYALSKTAWGKGYMTEASRKMLRYGFEELGLSMITVGHYTFNDRSRRVIEKCGFKPEGIMRRAEIYPSGEVQDVATYSLMAEEWRLSAQESR